MRDMVLSSYLNEEKNRQRRTIELVASENFVSKDVMKFVGSILTNKYAEGYPNKRYYGGCNIIDNIENLTKERLIEVFKARKYHANVQPHSGSQANMAVYKAMLNIGDTILAINNKSINNASDFRHELYKYSQNDDVTVKYLHNGQTKTAKIKLTKRQI